MVNLKVFAPLANTPLNVILHFFSFFWDFVILTKFYKTKISVKKLN